MSGSEPNKKDRSTSLLWTPFTPIDIITDDNIEIVIDWLKDRKDVLTWFTSIVTGSLVLLTVFGKKPGLQSIDGMVLSLSLLCMVTTLLVNLICVWQIPKWKYVIRVKQVSNGKRMMIDLEVTSWISLIAFLAALVLAAIGNSGS
jgi:hypothetical protein